MVSQSTIGDKHYRPTLFSSLVGVTLKNQGHLKRTDMPPDTELDEALMGAIEAEYQARQKEEINK